MTLEEYIQSLTGKTVAKWPAETFQDVILAENLPAEKFNTLLLALNPGGGIFFLNSLSLVHHLIQKGFPVLMSREVQNLSVFLPLEDEPLDSYKINHRDIPKTEDRYLIEWIWWYDKYANKNLVCERRFWEHLIWNRFHLTEQHFLP